MTAVTASDYHRIKNGANTVAFRMVLRVDNNCCQAEVEPIRGHWPPQHVMRFIEYGAWATTTLTVQGLHPNGFADFDFSVIRGVVDRCQ